MPFCLPGFFSITGKAEDVKYHSHPIPPPILLHLFFIT